MSMSELKTRFDAANVRLERAKQHYATQSALEASLIERLTEEYGVSTIEDAEVLLREKEASLLSLNDSISRLLDDVESRLNEIGA